MKIVYIQTPLGWQPVFTAQSFQHACEVCSRLQLASPDESFCVNS